MWQLFFVEFSHALFDVLIKNEIQELPLLVPIVGEDQALVGFHPLFATDGKGREDELSLLDST